MDYFLCKFCCRCSLCTYFNGDKSSTKLQLTVVDNHRKKLRLLNFKQLQLVGQLHYNIHTIHTCPILPRHSLGLSRHVNTGLGWGNGQAGYEGL